MVWFALAIGNSRLHWAQFQDTTLESTWDTPHGTIAPSDDQAELWLATVVPDKALLWQHHPKLRQVTLEDIPLQNLYPTLGIDRALAILGAGELYGFPTLVIDGGTALTFTGVDGDRRLVGGAILPGLQTQLTSLSHKTAALPAIQLPPQLPTRWAASTAEAIQSGVVHTVLAGMQGFIEAWRRDYPSGAIVLTGGDSSLLFSYLSTAAPDLATQVAIDPNLIFWGIRGVRQRGE